MENEKKEIEIDITKIVLSVYTQIANWHNADFRTDAHKGDALKVVSHEIVQNIVDEIFSQLNTNTRTEIKRGDKIVGSKESKDVDSFQKNEPQDAFSKLFKKEK